MHRTRFSWPCKTRVSDSMKIRRRACSMPSSPPSPMEWAWGSRSAVRSSRHTEAVCGPRATPALASHSSSSSRPGPKREHDVGIGLQRRAGSDRREAGTAYRRAAFDLDRGPGSTSVIESGPDPSASDANLARALLLPVTPRCSTMLDPSEPGPRAAPRVQGGVMRILEPLESLGSVREEVPARRIVAESAAMRELLETVALVGPKDITVLLRGETGTGKEVIAPLLHTESARASKPLVRFNCAAIPADLAEAELFGHARGAFTGADRAREGFFSVANGGTLVLDEVGELPLSVQAKLLRVLQEGEIQQVG